MSKEIVFLFGLPCSGKSTWYKDKVSKGKFKDYTYVNADDIKFEFPDYDESVVSMYSTEAIAIAEKRVKYNIVKGENIVMDAGSINNKYTMGLLTYAKKHGYTTTMINLNTPYEICIERNNLRARKVPTEVITSKAVKKDYHWSRYENSGFVDNAITIDYFTKKHMFFDMDGVLAAYKGLPVVNGKVDFVNSNYYRYLPVVQQVRNIIGKLAKSGTKIYVLSAVPTSIAGKEKIEWLKDHYYDLIDMDNVYFVSSGKYKAEMFSDLATKLKLKKKDMCLVEDTHHIIKTARQEYGMDAIHISQLLTDY